MLCRTKRGVNLFRWRQSEGGIRTSKLTLLPRRLLPLSHLLCIACFPSLTRINYNYGYNYNGNIYTRKGVNHGEQRGEQEGKEALRPGRPGQVATAGELNSTACLHLCGIIVSGSRFEIPGRTQNCDPICRGQHCTTSRPALAPSRLPSKLCGVTSVTVPEQV